MTSFLQLRWAEAGMQKGGGYMCGGGCGLPSSRFDCYSSTVLSQIPSYEAMPCRAIEGTYDRNLHALSSAEARVELPFHILETSHSTT